MYLIIVWMSHMPRLYTFYLEGFLLFALLKQSNIFIDSTVSQLGVNQIYSWIKS